MFCLVVPMGVYLSDFMPHSLTSENLVTLPSSGWAFFSYLWFVANVGPAVWDWGRMEECLTSFKYTAGARGDSPLPHLGPELQISLGFCFHPAFWGFLCLQAASLAPRTREVTEGMWRVFVALNEEVQSPKCFIIIEGGSSPDALMGQPDPKPAAFP